MSTAAAFRHHRPFPFCPDAFDIDSLTPGALTLSQLFVRDLTLADAMRLYWNLESIRLQAACSGARFSTSGGGYAEVALAYDQTHVSTQAPRSRVCLWGGSPSAMVDFGEKTQANAITQDKSNMVPPEATTYLDYSIQLRFREEPAGLTPVSLQDDGLYTLWLLLTGGPPSPAAEPYVLLGGVFSTEYPLLDTISKTLLSGTIEFGLYPVEDDPNFIYDTGGVIDSLTLTPAYFTY